MHLIGWLYNDVGLPHGTDILRSLLHFVTAIRWTLKRQTVRQPRNANAAVCGRRGIVRDVRNGTSNVVNNSCLRGSSPRATALDHLIRFVAGADEYGASGLIQSGCWRAIATLRSLKGKGSTREVRRANGDVEGSVRSIHGEQSRSQVSFVERQSKPAARSPRLHCLQRNNED